MPDVWRLTRPGLVETRNRLLAPRATMVPPTEPTPTWCVRSARGRPSRGDASVNSWASPRYRARARTSTTFGHLFAPSSASGSGCPRSLPGPCLTLSLPSPEAARTGAAIDLMRCQGATSDPAAVSAASAAPRRRASHRWWADAGVVPPRRARRAPSRRRASDAPPGTARRARTRRARHRGPRRGR